MQGFHKALWAVTLLIVGGCTAPGGTRMGGGIEVQGTGASTSVSVPDSRLSLTLPTGNWSRKSTSVGGATANPRYFYFEDRGAESRLISGWFEPDNLYPGMRNQWESATASWKKQGLPVPVNVSFEKLGSWDVVLYDHYIGTAVNSHLRAHRVQAGTWIDLHISTTTKNSSAENRKTLKQLLQGIAITEKRNE